MTRFGRITSTENATLRDVLRLRHRRARARHGRFLVEGAREAQRALAAGYEPLSVFVEEGSTPPREVLTRCERAGARVLLVAPRAYAKIALRERSEGVLAVFRMPDPSPETLSLPRNPLVLASAGIEKPGNLGALLRSADAFGVDAFVAEGGVDLWSPNVVRASLGSLFSVKVGLAPRGMLVPWLRSRGLRIVAASPKGARRLSEIDWKGAVAILLGPEDSGLSEEQLSQADVSVRISMRGKADSLNVSVSAGILLYEADRQRARGS